GKAERGTTKCGVRSAECGMQGRARDATSSGGSDTGIHVGCGSPGGRSSARPYGRRDRSSTSESWNIGWRELPRCLSRWLATRVHCKDGYSRGGSRRVRVLACTTRGTRASGPEAASPAQGGGATNRGDDSVVHPHGAPN